ncbi:hypothetical protein [Streptomyces sp. NPDC094468]
MNALSPRAARVPARRLAVPVTAVTLLAVAAPSRPWLTPHSGEES